MAPRKADSNTAKKIQPRKMAPKQIAKAAKAAARSSKQMKQIFIGKTISFSGGFTQFGEAWTHEKMAGWIKAHGGEYVREVTDDTTHLICTLEDYKKKTAQVKKAWKLDKGCYIVVKDWLEDCLTTENSKKRCRVEKGYTADRVLKRLDRSRAAKQNYHDSFKEGVRAGHEFADNHLNHVYVDGTGFEYKVVLTRVNTEGKVKFEKYTIYIFESNANPHHYMTGAKMSQPGRPPTFWRVECHPKHFWDAFKDFCHFFRKKTGMGWDDRFDGLPQHPENFRYDPPKPGRPVGYLPVGKKAPVDEEKEDTEMDDTCDANSGLVHDSESDVSDPYDSEPSPPLVVHGRRSVSIASISSGSASSSSKDSSSGTVSSASSSRTSPIVL